MNRFSRRTWILAGVALTGVVVFVLVWFQPQTLLFDVEVDDELPGVAAEPSPTAPAPDESMEAPEASPEATPDASPEASPTETAPPTPAGPVTLASGSFASRSHPTTGGARVLDLGADGRVLRLDELKTDNGPDLFVYLSSAPPDAPAGAFDDDYVDLGRLKGNVGNQNYEVPADVDLDRYSTVVIWCRRFTVVFGVAPLATA